MALSRGGQAEVFDLTLDGVRVTLLPTAHSRGERSPTPREVPCSLTWLPGTQSVPAPGAFDLRRASGQPRAHRRARAAGTAVVFHLHNFGYNDRRGFTDVSAVIFPSDYSRRHFQRRSAWREQ